ncbi:MAG: hypothetical protein RL645_1319 [Actinomycetota bacterium]|jgi:proteasome accessory factor B
MEPRKYDQAGRLFAIVAALILADKRGLTKEQLFRVVEPYALDIKAGKSEDALEQQFTRDKNLLRNNGFVLEPERTDEGDKYSLVERDLIMPSGEELNSRQLQLLNIATEVWNQGAISAEVGRAAIRLRGLGIAAAGADALTIAPRIQTHEPAFLALSEAVGSHIRVEFDYRKPGSKSIERRHVQPWALRNISSQWLLQCWDEDQDEVRNFLLKRIVSKVDLVKVDKNLSTFSAPSAAQLDAAKTDLQSHIERNVAVLKLSNRSEAWFHFIEGSTSSEEWIEHKLNFMDEHLLAEDLRSYGRDVQVVSPASLAEAVAEGFAKVVAAHA